MRDNKAQHNNLKIAILHLGFFYSGGKMIIHTPNAWMIKPLYFLAQIFFRWKKQEVHVNEQSFFSLYRNLDLFEGKVRIFLSRERTIFLERFIE